MTKHIDAPSFESARAPVKLGDECGIFNVHGSAALHCPVCDGYYLHQHRVQVNQRPAEDDRGVSTLVENGQALTVIATDSFTGRRDDLAIEFSCEQCEHDRPGVRHVLRIAQHKGNTFMYWELRSASS